MKNTIPLELSLAQRLAATQLINPFCGFCRTEKAAVDELQAKLAARPSEPETHSREEDMARAAADYPDLPYKYGSMVQLAGTDFVGMIDGYSHGSRRYSVSLDVFPAQMKPWPAPDDHDEQGLEDAAIRAMGGPARQPVDYDELRRLIAEAKARPGECAWDSLDKAAGAAIEDVLLDLEQAQATIKEMGEQIDALVAEKDATSAGTIAVDRRALRQVLGALQGPDYMIRELQATRGLPGGANPIDALIGQTK